MSVSKDPLEFLAHIKIKNYAEDSMKTQEGHLTLSKGVKRVLPEELKPQKSFKS